MISAAVAALACLSLARCPAAESHGLRAYTHNTHASKDFTIILANIEERLRTLETISAVQAKQARRLDVIQDKLDRVETTFSLKLERAQLAAERLEHRLHLLQTSIQTAIKESSDKLEQSQSKISEIALNLTNHLDSHRHLLEKVSGAYVETWRRGLVLESLTRDGLSLVNVTRRELADGLRALAKRHREARLNSVELESTFKKRLSENSYNIDLKMNEILDIQKNFVDSCQRIQADAPTQITDILGRLIDSVINMSSSTTHELKNIQSSIRGHDFKIAKLMSSGRSTQNEASCQRLENIVRNTSLSTFKETELQQLTEKFVALTDRADAALQRLEARLGAEYSVEQEAAADNVTAQADRLIYKINGIKSENDYDENEWEEDQETAYFDDGGGDMMDEDKEILNKVSPRKKEIPTERPPHRRHLHKHPYDRGPNNSGFS